MPETWSAGFTLLGFAAVVVILLTAAWLVRGLRGGRRRSGSAGVRSRRGPGRR